MFPEIFLKILNDNESTYNAIITKFFLVLNTIGYILVVKYFLLLS